LVARPLTFKGQITCSFGKKINRLFIFRYILPEFGKFSLIIIYNLDLWSFFIIVYPKLDSLDLFHNYKVNLMLKSYQYISSFKTIYFGGKRKGI